MSLIQKSLLIASVFAPSSHNRDWFRLQKAFIEETTEVSFDYRLFLNGVDAADFDTAEIIHHNTDNLGHSVALKQVLNFFREHRYSAYLILDSDCFPVKRGWHRILIEQMRACDKSAAAIVRTENLDIFPHPSAFFLLEEAINDPQLDFGVSLKTRTLLGEEVSDVGGTMQGWNRILPLLRTNMVNLHPVAAGIYHHLFYHHGGGSRDFNFRVLKRFRYHDHWYDMDRQEAHGAALYRALMSDPYGFIKYLMGEGESLKDLLGTIFRLPGSHARLVRPFLKNPNR